MRALKLSGRVDSRGRVVVTQPVDAPEGDVEIILLVPDITSRSRSKKGRRDIMTEPFIGMWKDREDIRDSASFVDTLRRRIEKREDRG